MPRKTIVCLSLLLLSGCAAPLVVGGAGSLWTHAAEDRGISGSVNDQILRYRLNQVLDGGLSNFDGIELTVYKNRVLLTGVAADESVRKEAVRIVSITSGVRDVIDGMDTQATTGFGEYSRDGWITTKLKACLFADEDLVAPNYVIRTFNKTVYVFGTARSQQEIQKVIEHAADITGVKRVVPLIELYAPAQNNQSAMPPH